MDNPLPPSPPPAAAFPNLALDSAAQVLKQAASSFFSSLLTLALASLLLFSFRTVIQSGSLYVTDFVDRDPSVEDLISQLDGMNLRPQSPANIPPVKGHRYRSYLRRNGDGNLDDFISGDLDQDRTLFGMNRKPQLNMSATFVNLNFVEESGFRVLEIIRRRLKFQFHVDDSAEVMRNQSLGFDRQVDGGKDYQLLLKGLEIWGFLYAAHWWAILGFVLSYSFLLGVVFIAVVKDLLGSYSSCLDNVRDGSRIGFMRLPGIVFMWWYVKDLTSDLLGACFFGEIQKQNLLFRLYVRLKLMPFGITSHWGPDFGEETSAFMFTWFLVHFCWAFVFALNFWVGIAESKTVRQVVKKGCYLLCTMIEQAFQIYYLEALFRSVFLRRVLRLVCGELFADLFQSVVEVYFMVAWLILYLAARCKDDVSNGRTFGQRELEGLTHL